MEVNTYFLLGLLAGVISGVVETVGEDDLAPGPPPGTASWFTDTTLVEVE